MQDLLLVKCTQFPSEDSAQCPVSQRHPFLRQASLRTKDSARTRKRLWLVSPNLGSRCGRSSQGAAASSFFKLSFLLWDLSIEFFVIDISGECQQSLILLTSIYAVIRFCSYFLCYSEQSAFSSDAFVLWNCWEDLV